MVLSREELQHYIASVPDDRLAAVERSTARMGGQVVFRGTRVPVRTLLDYIEEGDSLDQFLDDFPTVSRAGAVAFLDLAGMLVGSD